MAEHIEQAAVIEWFDKQYPSLRLCLFAIPNGAYLGKDRLTRIKVMKKLKKEGLRPGVSDLFLAVPNEKFHGMFIEMKDQGKNSKNLSESQHDFLQLMNKQGYAAVWASGFIEAKDYIRDYLRIVNKTWG